ncbi:MAG: LAGLIDADG family homing endonuclease [Candidatus Lokiarchaeota archaeon]|nr:LAGLIDADG family homing endonuclease [Candidatus Lokiarchaeota archaeon]
MGYKLHGDRLSYNKLGILVGRNKSYIKFKMSICKENSDYYFSSTDLSNMKDFLRLNRCLTQEIIELFIEYENNSLIREINHKIYHYHPKFKMDYFKNIDTKKKAYFLGLIYADGSISNITNIQLLFDIGFSSKDKILLYNLSETIGYEKKFIRKKKNKDFYGISIKSNEFCKHLIRHGIIVGKRKTYHIKLPNLPSRSLYLAFLLGFFDGDGTANTTRITTASLLFLKQIKRQYKIQYNPKQVFSVFKNGNKVYPGSAYIMYLGGDLFNELLDNFHDSLPRKRKRFTSYDKK